MIGHLLIRIRKTKMIFFVREISSRNRELTEKKKIQLIKRKCGVLSVIVPKKGILFLYTSNKINGIIIILIKSSL